MKDNTELKKQSERPADPKLVELKQPEEAPQIKLVPFPNGDFFQLTPHPSGKSIAIIGCMEQPTTPPTHKVIQLAGTPHVAIAEMICAAVNTVQKAIKEHQHETENNNSQSNQS